NAQRGACYPRQIGTSDMVAVEVDPAIPVASGSFTKVTAPSVGSHTIAVTYTDDVAMNLASIQNNSKAVRITGPNGFNVLATYVSATPGTGAKSETVTYSFAPPGGGWDNGDDGFYTVSIEPNQISDGTNFVTAAAVNTLQVAIPKTFIVDTVDDTDDGNYTVNNLSIREAIKLANQNVGVSDLITFSPTVFSSPVTITLFGGEMFITDPVTMTGPGTANLIIDGGLNSRLLTVSPGVGYWGSTVTITGMTFANGRQFPSVAGTAAGITNETASLVIDGCELYGNSNNSAGGAIILNNHWASLTLKNSYLHHNSSFQGAGVLIGNNGSAVSSVPNTVQVVIQNTIFDSNTSQTSATSNGGSGAGVFSLGGASITIDNSTFTNNTVGTSGGAIGVTGVSSLTMQNSTVSNNAAVGLSASGFTGGGNGGGLYFGSSATATLTSNTITNNFAGSPDIAFPSSGGNGGGINVAGGALLTINGGTLNNNTGNATSTTGGGGGLFLAGSATVSLNNATIAGNVAKSLGGGVMASALTTAATASGTLYITGSTISGNTSQSAAANTGGGGLFVNGTGGMTLITNSTISGNSAGFMGGGILAGGSTAMSGNLTIRNSTIANNTAQLSGGGINFNSTSTTATITLTLNSSIVSNNTGPSGTDLFTNSTKANINAISSLVGSNAGGFGTGTVTGAPIIGGANLGALASNGGPTQTHALNAGSLAINAGSANTNVLTTVNGAVGAATTTTSITVNSATQLGVGQRIIIDSEVMTVASVISATSITVNRAQEGTTAATHAVGANISFVAALPATDQRGVGFSRNSGGSVDIGAFEVQSAAAKITGVQINDGSAQRSRVLSLKVSFDQAVTLPVNPANAFTLTRVSDNAVIGLNAIQSGNNVTLTFTPGSAVEFNSLADGRYTLTVLAAQVNGGNFDGDGNGTAGDNYVLNSTPYVNALTPATGIFRLFGDGTGNGKVESDDFLQFRLAFLSSNVAFDYDGSGQVDSSDFLQFRLNFLKQIV
ncbi:MAG: hypothetical protein K1X57_22380, partial [Gemmataceae bacterium]|nr:hypothetical protein [Gemmataceae bacterium]